MRCYFQSKCIQYNLENTPVSRVTFSGRVGVSCHVHFFTLTPKSLTKIRRRSALWHWAAPCLCRTVRPIPNSSRSKDRSSLLRPKDFSASPAGYHYRLGVVYEYDFYFYNYIYSFITLISQYGISHISPLLVHN